MTFVFFAYVLLDKASSSKQIEYQILLILFS